MNTNASRNAPASNSQLRLAIDTACKGLPISPVNPRTKSPLNDHGHLEATTDPTQIIAWWTRWPDALVAMPTGERTRLLVLDVDGAAGRHSLGELLARLGLDQPSDLTGYIVATPGGGLHLYFRIREGERPRTRAGDIAAGLDSRGEGGYIIAAGNRFPDGREYRPIGPARDLADAGHAPRDLLYLATFNAREHAEIAAEADLQRAIRNAAPAEWTNILEAHQRAKVHRISSRSASVSPDAMRRQALSDLHQAAAEYADLRDGRRNGLFTLACRLARYVANGVLGEPELRNALREAANANGAIAAHGSAWLDGVIRRALAYGARDALPPLAREFRTSGGRP